MASKGNAAAAAEVERGEYVIGIAVVLAALIISATLYIAATGIQGEISRVKLIVNAPAAGAQQSTGQPSQVQQPPAAADWSFVSSDPGVGPADAEIVVVEFADFQCPYCGIVYGSEIGGAQYDSLRGTATKIKNEYAATGKIRFVFHTMAFLGQESIDAGNAALCAREVGGDAGFFAMHDKLFENQNGENQGAYSKSALKRLAAEAGFGSSQMSECIDSGKYYAQVASSTEQASAVGVEGTPAFYINGQAASPQYAQLKAAIDALLAAN